MKAQLCVGADELFRNTGLERSERLAKDLEWFESQGHTIPEPGPLGEECACFHLPLLQCLLCPLSWGSLHWKEGMQLLPQFRCLAFLISLGFCRIITAVEDIRMWFPDVWEGTGG